METENKNKNEQQFSSIRQEFSLLGQNIQNVFGSAWDSNEKQTLQDDIKNGLNDFGEMLGRLIEDLHIKDISEKVIKGVEDIGERVRSGEIEDKTKNDLIQILQKINLSLAKVSSNFTPKEEDTVAKEETE